MDSVTQTTSGLGPPTHLGIYPWDRNGVRLARLLTNGPLLGLTFGADPERASEYLRRYVKQAHGRSNLPPRGNVADDAQFLLLACDVLGSPAARGMLFKILTRDFGNDSIPPDRRTTGRPKIAQAMFKTVVQSAAVPDLGDVCETREYNRRFLLVPLFDEWLAGHVPSGEGIRDLAVFGAAFAMLQPDDGPAIFQVLAARVPGISTLIGEAGSCGETEPDEALVDDIPGPSDAAAASAASIDVLPPPVDDMDAPITLSVDQIRERRRIADEALRVAQERAIRLSGLLSDHDDTRRRVVEGLDTLAALPFLRGSLGAADTRLSFGRLEYAAVMDRLRYIEADIAAIITAHNEVATLTSRLKDEGVLAPPPAVEVSLHSKLSDITASLDTKAMALREQFDKIARSRAAATEFIGRFMAADAQTAADLVDNTDGALWVDLAHFVLSPITPGGVATGHADVDGRRLAGRRDVVGILAAMAWAGDPTAGIAVIERGLSANPAADELPPAEQAEVLALFTHDDLTRIAHRLPARAGAIARMIAEAALRSGRCEDLKWIEPFIDIVGPPACAAVYREMALEFDRFGAAALESSLTQFFRPAADAAKTADTAARCRQKVLDAINHSPTMEGVHHELRVAARAAFLLPLRPHVEAGDAAAAFRAWRAFKVRDDIGRMVDTCVAAIPAHRDVDYRHRESASRYLNDFEDELTTWQSAVRASSARPVASDGLRPALRQLAQAATSRADCQCLLRVLEAALTAPRMPGNVPLDFGRRCTDPARIDDPIGRGLVRPQMLDSWIEAVRGDGVPVRTYFADTLRAALAEPGAEAADVTETLMEEFLRRDQFAAADAAVRWSADGRPVDAPLVTWLEQKKAERRRAILAGHEELLEEARAMSDDAVATCLAGVDDAVGALDEGEAREWLEHLESAVAEVRRQNNPNRLRLAQWLTEADQAVSPQETTDELQARVDECCAAVGSRRLHIAALHSGTQYGDRLPPDLREPWEAAAHRLDRPKLWPADEMITLRLAYGIEAAIKLIAQRLYRVERENPSAVRPLRFGLQSWVVERVVRACGGDEAAALDIERLSDGIENKWWTDAELSEFLGIELGEVVIRPLEPAGPTVAEREKRHELLRPAARLSREQTVAEFRQFVRACAADEMAVSHADEDDLADACGRRDWSLVRRTAAHLVNGLPAPATGDGRPDDAEIAYAVARGWTAQADEPPKQLQKVLTHAAMASVLSMLQYEYNLDRDDAERSALCFVAALPDEKRRALTPEQAAGTPGHAVTDQSLAPRLADLFAHTAAAAHSDGRYLWLVDLFQRAALFDRNKANGAETLTIHAWERLSGKESARPRADLLYTLFKMRQLEVLNMLADRYAPKLSAHIKRCVKAFDDRANPEVYRDGVQSARVFHQLTTSKMNIAAFTQLIQKLESAKPDAVDRAAVEYKLDDFHVAGDGYVTLSVAFSPSDFDWPDSLDIEFAAGEGRNAPVRHTIVRDNDMTRPRVVRLVVPVGETRGVIQLPFVMEGKTITGRPINLRGTWTHDTGQTAKDFSPITPYELAHYWPGAGGDPQTNETKSFYGRVAEREQIDRLLSGQDMRQRSLMIVGQRRIGKTSLILEILRGYPARAGGVCGIFCDIGAIGGRTDQPLAKLLFDRVVAFLESDAGQVNESLRKRLREGMGLKSFGDLKLSPLVRHIEPERSLAVALHQLADILRERAGIDRLALFIDEFQVVLGRPAGEVELLMRDLRPMVQQSRQVSLVLAGSGSVSRLYKSYDAAMFGSIDSIELKGFNWPDEKIRRAGEADDREAIRSTFIPVPVQKRLVAVERGRSFDSAFDALAVRAHELCGGHPYYLSMLGYAAASCFGGRPLTRAMLEHAADEMVAGRVLGHTQIGAHKFYGHVFQSLDMPNERMRNISQVLLAYVASQVTIQYPWIYAERALDVPALMRITTEHERLDALVRLREEHGVLIRESNARTPRYRIRIPVLAAALRHDAETLEYEALESLRKLSGGMPSTAADGSVA